MQDITISIHVGSRISQSHNARKIKGEEHIDYNKSRNNYVWSESSNDQAYVDLFSDAIREYNGKQSRRDRKIDFETNGLPDGAKIKNYMKRQKGKPRELIIQFGNSADGIDKNLKVRMLKRFSYEFQMQNPNLKVVAIYLHTDEADPHLHIDFIPWFTNASKGCSKLVGFDKALAQQLGMDYKRERKDDEGNKIKRQTYSPYFDAWRLNMSLELSQIARLNGLSPIEGELRRKWHLSTKEYRNLMNARKEAQNALYEAKTQNRQLLMNLDGLQIENDDMENVISAVQDVAHNGTSVDKAILNEFARVYWDQRENNYSVFDSILNTIEALKCRVQSLVDDITDWFNTRFAEKDR